MTVQPLLCGSVDMNRQTLDRSELQNVRMDFCGDFTFYVDVNVVRLSVVEPTKPEIGKACITRSAITSFQTTCWGMSPCLWFQ